MYVNTLQEKKNSFSSSCSHFDFSLLFTIEQHKNYDDKHYVFSLTSYLFICYLKIIWLSICQTSSSRRSVLIYIQFILISSPAPVPHTNSGIHSTSVPVYNCQYPDFVRNHWNEALRSSNYTQNEINPIINLLPGQFWMVHQTYWRRWLRFLSIHLFLSFIFFDIPKNWFLLCPIWLVRNFTFKYSGSFS